MPRLWPAQAVRPLLGALLYFPSRTITQTPGDAGLEFEDLEVVTEDGESLGAWWIAGRPPTRGHLLFCHGNAGNVGDRVFHSALLSAAGFDVMMFDYRGYGRSTGRPDEDGTYRDARAARGAVLQRPGVDPGRLLYLGESLGGGVALKLAIEAPPRGLVLQSTFTGIRDVARRHYPFIPSGLVPEAYPSLRLIAGLRVPLLVLHGDRDEIVPLDHGQKLFEATSAPKRLRVFSGVGHNDLVERAGAQYVEELTDWVARLEP